MSANTVRAHIDKIGGYFGHADQKSLIEYLFVDIECKQYTVPNIFLNHGNDSARKILKNAINSHCSALQKQYKDSSLYQTNIEIPMSNQKIYDLDGQCWINTVSIEEQLLQILITHKEST